MVRANRYALAAALGGSALEPTVRALHGCDNPVCVRVSGPGETGLLHVIGGSQRDNMVRMARAGRSWDGDAVAACVGVDGADPVVRAGRHTIEIGDAGAAPGERVVFRWSVRRAVAQAVVDAEHGDDRGDVSCEFVGVARDGEDFDGDV